MPRPSYRGFHQYNIDKSDDNHLIIWNNENRHDVNRLLEGIATVKCSVTDKGHIVGVITKTAEVPEITSDRVQKRMSEMLQLTVGTLNSPLFSLRYHFASLTASIAHPIMRRIPRSYVDRLKKLLSHKS